MRGGVEKIENLYLTIAESFFDNSFDFGIVEVPIRRIARFLPGNGRDLPKKKIAVKNSRKCAPQAPPDRITVGNHSSWPKMRCVV